MRTTRFEPPLVGGEGEEEKKREKRKEVPKILRPNLFAVVTVRGIKNSSACGSVMARVGPQSRPAPWCSPNFFQNHRLMMILGPYFAIGSRQKADKERPHFSSVRYVFTAPELILGYF
jgi:hypothetical protein